MWVEQTVRAGQAACFCAGEGSFQDGSDLQTVEGQQSSEEELNEIVIYILTHRKLLLWLLLGNINL